MNEITNWDNNNNGQLTVTITLAEYRSLLMFKHESELAMERERRYEQIEKVNELRKQLDDAEMRLKSFTEAPTPLQEVRTNLKRGVANA